MRLGLGNPAADEVVRDYLRSVTADQLKARVTPKQATPFLIDKLARLALYLNRLAEVTTIFPS
jgi:pseudouridine-5'-phosphate glycosidase